MSLIGRVMVANIGAEVHAGRFRVNPASGTALIDAGTAPSRSYLPAIGNREGNLAQILSWSPDRVEIEVDSMQPGILVRTRHITRGGSSRSTVNPPACCAPTFCSEVSR